MTLLTRGTCANCEALTFVGEQKLLVCDSLGKSSVVVVGKLLGSNQGRAEAAAGEARREIGDRLARWRPQPPSTAQAVPASPLTGRHTRAGLARYGMAPPDDRGMVRLAAIWRSRCNALHHLQYPSMAV
jgi:hypothetical protein